MQIRVTILFLLLAVLLNGQSLQSRWDHTYRIGENATVHAIVQSFNGWIIAVGEVELPRKEKDGFFLVIDPENGRQISSQTYGGEQEDVLLDIRQAVDGTFYLAGYSESKSNGRSDAWLLHVDEKGLLMEEERFGTGQEERFTHLEILEDGALLAAGQIGRKSTGYVWLTRIEKMRKVSDRSIGEGQFKDVVGIYQSPNNSIWMAGNLEKPEKGLEETGVSWLVELDKNGNVKNGSKQIIKVDDFGELKQMKRSVFGDMILVGTTFNAAQRDTWVVELSEEGRELLNFSYGEPLDEFGIGLLKTVQDHFLLARQIYRGPSQVVVIDGRGGELVQDISKGERFIIRDMVYTFGRDFVIAGNYRQGKEDNLYLTCLQPKDLLAIARSKTEAAVTCSAPRLHDENGDGVLKRGERGAIIFEITNSGEADIIDGNIEIKGLPSGNPFQQVFVSFLPQGRKHKVSIPINGDDITGNSMKLTIVVKERSFELASFPFEIRRRIESGTGDENRVFEVITDWETPYSNSRNFNNKHARVFSGNVPVSHTATATTELKTADYRVKKNGVWLEDNKAWNPRLEVNLRDGHETYRFRNYFTFEAQLDTGYNEIIIEILKDKKVIQRDTLLFEFFPKRPNLHVVVVGPANVGLAHNQQDALDFAALMSAQAQQNYFNQVFIDTLVTEKETTQRNLSIAFEDLKKRHWSNNKPDRIAKSDVLVVFISSHGLIVDEEGQRRFKIMPSDYDSEYKSVTTVDYKKVVLDNLNKIDCKKIVFIDACHSGAAGVKDDRGNLSKYLLELNALSPGLLSISSSDEEESSYENDRWQNGAFTKAIEEVLRGEGMAKDLGETTREGLKAISLAALYDYLIMRVPNLVKSVNKDYEQNPAKRSNNPELEKIKFLIAPAGK